MTTAEDVQSVWDDYYTRLRQRRLSEAQRLLAAAREAGVNDDTTLYLASGIFRQMKMTSANCIRNSAKAMRFQLPRMPIPITGFSTVRLALLK